MLYIDILTLIVLSLSPMMFQWGLCTPVKSISTKIRFISTPLSSAIEERHHNNNNEENNLMDQGGRATAGAQATTTQDETWLNAEQVYLETPSTSQEDDDDDEDEEDSLLSNLKSSIEEDDQRQQQQQQQQQQQRRPYFYLTKMSSSPSLPEYSKMLYGSYSSRKLYTPTNRKRSNTNTVQTANTNNLDQAAQGPRLSPSLKQMIEKNPFARAWLALLLQKIVQEQPVPYIFKYGRK